MDENQMLGHHRADALRKQAGRRIADEVGNRNTRGPSLLQVLQGLSTVYPPAHVGRLGMFGAYNFGVPIDSMLRPMAGDDEKGSYSVSTLPNEFGPTQPVIYRDVTKINELLNGRLHDRGISGRQLDYMTGGTVEGHNYGMGYYPRGRYGGGRDDAFGPGNDSNAKPTPGGTDTGGPSSGGGLNPLLRR